MSWTRCLGFLLAICSAPAANLKQDLDRLARSIGGHVGVSAVAIESGEHVAFQGDQPFFMASVVKFPVALRVLELVDEGKLRLDQKVAVREGEIAPGVKVLGGNFRPGMEFTI